MKYQNVLVNPGSVRMLALLSLLGATIHSWAQPTPADVVHDISWTPKGAQAGNILPSVNIVHFEHAWGVERGPDDKDSKTNPLAQPGYFKPYGKDNLSSSSGKIRQFGGGKVNMDSSPVGPGGTPAGGTSFSAEVLLNSGTHALGRTTAIIAPYGVGGPVTGSITFHTEVTLGTAEFNDGYAFAGGEITIRARHSDKKGRIRLGRTWHLGRGANAAWGRGKTRAVDPIVWRIEEVGSGAVYEGNFASIESTTENGIIDAMPGGIIVDATNGRLVVRVGSPHMSVAGSLKLKVDNGVVTQSDDSGMFNGVLPPVGHTGPFFISMPAIEFDYDLNGVSNALTEADVTLEMGGDTEVEESNGGIDGEIQLQGFTRLPDTLGDQHPTPYVLSVHLPGSNVPIFVDQVLPDSLGEFHSDFDGVGQFDVYLKGATYLRQVFKNVPCNINPLQVLRLPFHLKNGDCDGNNSVTTDDYLIFNGAFDTTNGDDAFDPRADLDGDNNVTTDDYLLLSNNFDQDGD